MHIAERMEPFLLAGSGFDAAIHFEHPAWAGMHLHPLLEEVLVPVCSPALLAGAGAKPSLDALPRLHRRQNPDAWQAYAQAAGIVLTIGGGRALRPPFDADRSGAGRPGCRWCRACTSTRSSSRAAGCALAGGQDGDENFCLVLPEPIELADGPLRAFATWMLDEARDWRAR